MTSSALTVTSSPVPVKASGRRSRASEGVAVSAEPNGPGCAGGVSSLPAPVAQGEAVTARGGGGGGGGGCPGAARCRVSSAGSAPAPARPWVPALGPCPGSPPAPPAHGAAARSPLRRSAGRAHRYAEPDPGQGGVCEGVQTRVQAVPVTPVRLYLYPHSYKLHTSTALAPPPPLASVFLGGRVRQRRPLGAGRATAPGHRIRPPLPGAERHLLAARSGAAHRRARPALNQPTWAGGGEKQTGRGEKIIAYLMRCSAKGGFPGMAAAAGRVAGPPLGRTPTRVRRLPGRNHRVLESLSFLLTFYRLFARWHVTKVYDLR